MQLRRFYFFSLFPHYSLCVLLLPLRHLRSSNLLPRRVHVANNKVLGDLLHVLIVEEGVEAQLVCGRGGEENKQGGGEGEDAMSLNMHWPRERTVKVGPSVRR